MHQAALDAGVSTKLENPPSPPVLDNEQTTNPAGLPTVLEEDLVSPLLAANQYELVPECRTCYETFREWSELAEHLTKQPDHKKSFVKKHFNKLHREAVRDSDYLDQRCPMCARPFMFPKHLRGHQAHSHHLSPDRLPKYREDNNRHFKRRTDLEAWPR